MKLAGKVLVVTGAAAVLVGQQRWRRCAVVRESLQSISMRRRWRRPQPWPPPMARGPAVVGHTAR